jgi:hypothetical protein
MPENIRFQGVDIPWLVIDLIFLDNVLRSLISKVRHDSEMRCPFGQLPCPVYEFLSSGRRVLDKR